MKGFTNVGMLSLSVLTILALVIFVLPAFAAPFITLVIPNETNSSLSNQIFNFAVLNMNASVNITEVNITLPSGFVLIADSNSTTALNTNFSNTTNVVSWINTTTEGFAVGGVLQNFSISVSVPSIIGSPNFTLSTLDTNGVLNTTDLPVLVNDVSIPAWSSNQTSIPNNYSTTNYSQFNITWNDNVGINNVLLTIVNSTNASHVIVNNSSMSNTTFGSGIYNFSIVLPVGSFNWTVFANDTSNNVNSSDTWTFSISKASNPISLYFNTTLNSNAPYTYPSVLNATAFANGNVTLYRNNTPVANGISNASESIQLGVGINNYTVNVTGNQNYTDNITNKYYNVTISKGDPSSGMHIKIDNSLLDKSVVYGTSVNLTAYEDNIGDSGCNYTLYGNSVYIANTNNSTASYPTLSLAIGTYTYIYNTSGCTNWTSNTATISRILAVTGSSSGVSSSSGISTSSSPTPYVKVATGKVNISLSTLTTEGKMIATVAKYDGVAIRAINITVVNNVANLKLVITKLNALPSTVPYDINGIVYNYISVDEINITNSDIRAVGIRFAVNKSWLAENSINSSKITLYRWNGNSWTDLKANKSSEDSSEVFYTANSTGLSIFVIGVTGGVCTPNWSCNNWSGCANGQQTRACTDSNICGTTVGKPSESQSCTSTTNTTTNTTETNQTTGTSQPASGFPFLELAIVIIIIAAVSVLVFMNKAKILNHPQVTKLTAHVRRASVESRNQNQNVSDDKIRVKAEED